MRRIAKLTGGTLMITLADMEGEESFDASMLGSAEEVSEERICDDDHLVISGGKTQRCCSVLLRGANHHMLDEANPNPNPDPNPDPNHLQGQSELMEAVMQQWLHTAAGQVAAPAHWPAHGQWPPTPMALPP